jgi:hypothetical protein
MHFLQTAPESSLNESMGYVDFTNQAGPLNPPTFKTMLARSSLSYGEVCSGLPTAPVATNRTPWLSPSRD